jgi:hypothetical protein
VPCVHSREDHSLSGFGAFPFAASVKIMPSENTESDEVPEGVQWAVSCPRHGARAHLYLEGLKADTPELLHCSLQPGDFPPSCNHACMATFKLEPAKPADDGVDLEDTVAD